METNAVITENWLTRKPRAYAFEFTAVLAFFLIVAALAFRMEMLDAQVWMPASGASVYGHHEYWRAWTTLLAHGDLAHILGNLLLLIPFTYFLAGYFGMLIPLVGIFMGGLVNLLVLQTMPTATSLIGISGVVYWLGAVWITLFVLVDRRESWQRRTGKALVVASVIFMPDSYKPEVSYLSHLYGFGFGIAFALLFYAAFRRRFLAAEKIEYRFEPDEHEAEVVNERIIY